MLCPDRGRRRLDFKRFQGKAMFLDLPGYRHVARLEEELTERGAVSVCVMSVICVCVMNWEFQY